MMKKSKKIKENRTNIRFLPSLAELAYVHASKQIEFEDSTIQALLSKASRF